MNFDGLVLQCHDISCHSAEYNTHAFPAVYATPTRVAMYF